MDGYKLTRFGFLTGISREASTHVNDWGAAKICTAEPKKNKLSCFLCGPHPSSFIDHAKFWQPKGFTLLELLIVLLILAILTTIALPSFNTLISRRNLNQAASEMSRAVQLARSEAAKRGAPVRLGQVTAGDWGSGWQILADSNADGSYNDDPVHTGVRISADVAVEEGDDHDLAQDYISFSATGSLDPIDDFPELVFRDADCSYESAIQFRVLSSGEVQEVEIPCATN